MKSKWILTAIISAILIIGAGGILSAQTSTDQIAGYYVSVNGQSTGPYDIDGLKQLVQLGQLTKATPVWKDGMANWAMAGAVPELASLFPPAIPSGSSNSSSQTSGLKFSIIGGGLFQADLAHQILKNGNFDGYTDDNTVGGGVFLAFDITYAEIGISFIGDKTTYSGGGDWSGIEKNDKWTSTKFGIGLLGKYPINFNKVTLFPLLGFDYQVLLGQEYDGEKIDDYGDYSKSDYNVFWLKLGIGADFALTDQFFIRGEFLYGLRTLTKSEKNVVELNKDYGADESSITAHGPAIKLGVGYKF